MGKMQSLLDLESGDETNDKDLNDRALVILDRVKQLESMGYTFEGADASVELMRVMIEFSDVKSGKKWTMVSVDQNIISASLNALVDGFEYALWETVATCVLDFE